jgi:hypothetical protein
MPCNAASNSRTVTRSNGRRYESKASVIHEHSREEEVRASLKRTAKSALLGGAAKHRIANPLREFDQILYL